MATELHDNLAQLLAVCKMKVSAIQASARQNTTVANEAASVKEFLGDGIAYTRTLMADLRPEALNAHDLAAAVESVARRVQRHGLKVRVEDDGQPKPLNEDVLALLFESVRELLYNVVKHAGADEATVMLGRADGIVRVTVADAGAGFDPAERAVMPSEDGGFGLFSIRERLDLIGGRLEVDSAVGTGTRITLVAPLLVGTEIDDTEAASGIGSDGQIRVLLVDDHRVVRAGLRSIIDDQPDMRVVGEAADGQAAVELVRDLAPHVVVMDVNMSRVDGIEATRTLAVEAPHVRVIALSVREDAEAVAAMRLAGAADYLTKGGEAEALFATIRRVAAAKT